MDARIQAFEVLAKHPRLDALAGLVLELARPMAEARRARGWPAEAKEKVEALALTEEEAKTVFGDLRTVLTMGPSNETEALLVQALTAHAFASSPPKDEGAERKLAADALWLASATPFDALGLMDRALGDELAEHIWSWLAAMVRSGASGKSAAAGAAPEEAGGTRAEALVGAAALALSPSPLARKLVPRLRRELQDPWILHILGPNEASNVLEGELGTPPRSPIATIALAVTGILFVVAGARLFAKVALAFRRPATLRLGPNGVEVESRTEMLGRTLRERRIKIERAALVRAAREVRFPRVAFYAGLLALAIGSYLGVSLLVDGTRSASPSLLVLGIVIIGVGIAIDFFLSGLAVGVRGKCRVVFVPRRGEVLSIEGLDAAAADRALALLKE